jgi:hypothetical protein
VDAPELLIRPASVARFCTWAIAVLLLLHGVSQTARFAFGHDYQYGLASRVYLGAEMSIPNWFSAVLLLACGAVLLAIGRGLRRPHGDDSRYWTLLGIVFVVLSIDEAAALHDLVSPLFSGVFARLARDVGGPFGAVVRKPNYFWEIPGLLFALTVAALYVPFLLKLPRRTRNLFLVAGCVYIGGAVGVDFLEGWYSGLYGPKNPAFVALVTCEETLEMAGSSLFLFALLDYAQARFGGVTVVL